MWRFYYLWESDNSIQSVFENKQELAQKASYYLEHEDERRQIAENGHQKVSTLHSYVQRIDEMMHLFQESMES